MSRKILDARLANDIVQAPKIGDLMELTNEFSWVCVQTLEDKEKAYELEQIFYYNKLPLQIRTIESDFALWVPLKFKELSADIIENFMIDNLSRGFVKFNDDESPEDKIYIGREYERRAPPKFYFFLMLMALFLVFMRFIYGIDFL